MYFYANFFCYANFSIDFGPNFRGRKVSEGGKLPQWGAPCPPVEKCQEFFQQVFNWVFEVGGSSLPCELRQSSISLRWLLISRIPSMDWKIFTS